MPVDKRSRAAASIAQPLDARPLDARPLDARPLDARPLDARPLDARPLDARPLAAEAHVDGSWWPGVVLGWRHDEVGGSRAQVRVVVRGSEQLRWVELVAVRLPEVAGPSVAGRRPAPEPVVETVVMSRVEQRDLMAAGLPRNAGPRRRHASDLTAELPVVRPAAAEAAPGRHRAAAAPAAPSVAGRHRVQEDAGASTAAVAGPDLLTRPIRLGDVAGWPWSSAAVR